MMRSSIFGASTMLNVLIQHLPLQSLFWTKIWRAFRASDPNRCKDVLFKISNQSNIPRRKEKNLWLHERDLMKLNLGQYEYREPIK